MDPKDEIRQKVDITELVSEYVVLKPAGMNRMKGLCPFHTEKTASFTVSGDRQIWHCFGCNEGGDCFSFVMKMEGMDFPEALRHLGQKVGVEVKRFDSAQSNEKQRYSAMNELAAKFFRKILLESPSAQEARDYLAHRGITPELAEKFVLGLAPDAWDTLATFLANRGYTETDGERAGLLQRRKSGSGMIDRFRHRLMIPLRDQHGNVAGFTARTFSSLGSTDPDAPKYVNSPETALYRKGQILYGLDLAKTAIKQAGVVVIVEGNLDVIASHKAGVENVVASSGTAFTQDQLSLLKRYTTRVIFSFDADAAGYKAAKKGIALARQLGFDVRAAVLPESAGKDPDEAIQKDPELWRKCVSHSVPILTYVIERAVRGKDLNNVDDKRAVASEVLPELAVTNDVVEREHYLQLIADLIHTPIDSLRRAIQSTGSTPSKAPTNQTNTHPTPLSKNELTTWILLGLAVIDPKNIPALASIEERQAFPSELLSRLYKEIALEYHNDQDVPGAKNIFMRLRTRLSENQLTMDLVSLLDKAVFHAEELVADLPPNALQEQFDQLIQSLHTSLIQSRRKDMEADIRRAEQEGDTNRVKELLKKYHTLR